MAIMMMTYPALLVLGNLFMLLLAGACGWWLVAPWKERVANAKFIAPFAGLILLPAGTLLVYAATGLGFSLSVAIAALSLLTATALSRPWPALRVSDGLAVVLTVLVASLVASPFSFSAGEPSMLFLRGTDQAGYAQLAEWLLHHTVHQAPVASSARPLESWPAMMFASDPRFGSFALLGIVTLLRGGPALFSYDLVQALMLASAVLAMTGAFARGRVAATVLGLALMTGCWLDLGGSGYLGKLFGYPAALLLGGLLAGADECQPSRRFSFGATVLLFALAAASTYPGHVLALLAGGIGLAGAAATIFRNKVGNLSQCFGLQLTLLSMVAASFASGMVARPFQPGYPKWPGVWSDALAIAMGTKSLTLQGFMLGGLEQAAGIACLSAGAILAGMAIRAGNAVAAGLAAAPVAMTAALLVLGRTASLPQLVGFAGPALLIASVILASSAARRGERMLAAAMLAIILAMTSPNSAAAMRALFPARETAAYVLRQDELERFVAEFAGQDVILDVESPVQWSLAFMLLAGERMKLSYSSASWEALFGYRGWPAPPESTTAAARIVAAGRTIPASESIASTRQFLAVPTVIRPKPAERLPAALLRDSSVGIWEDGWLEKHATVAVSAGDAAALTLVIDVPGSTAESEAPAMLTLALDRQTSTSRALVPGDNRITLSLPASAEPRRLSLAFSHVQKLAAPDSRESGGRLLDLILSP